MGLDKLDRPKSAGVSTSSTDRSPLDLDKLDRPKCNWPRPTECSTDPAPWAKFTPSAGCCEKSVNRP